MKKVKIMKKSIFISIPQVLTKISVLKIKKELKGLGYE
jgi:hypothetical protein